MRTPAGQITIDGTGRAAGRGAYVCRAPECIDIAIKKGALSRVLKTPLPADLRAALIDETADPMTATSEGGSRGQE